MRGVVVAGGHGADDGEGAEAERRQRRLGAAGQHDVRVAPHDGAEASPMAMVPEAQLIPLVELGPVHSELDRDVAARRAGEDRERERRVHRPQPRRRGSGGARLSASATPPSAVPIIAPTRSGSSFARSSSASASASRVAATLNWEKRSSRRARRSSMWSVAMEVVAPARRSAT